MRIVIQDRRTGHYLEETGGWTTYLPHARDFVCSADAIKARQMHEVTDAALVFCFEREGYSIAVPLDPLGTPASVPADPMQSESRPRPASVPA
jgi:hypothetical protein